MTAPVTASTREARPAELSAPPGAPGAPVVELPRVLAALDSVRDPELDEPITALGFVSSCRRHPRR